MQPRSRVIPAAVAAAAVRPAVSSVPLVALGISAAAWIVLLFTTSGTETAGLHHHGPVESAQPLLVSLPLFLGAWMAMVAAMMLPASAPALRELPPCRQ